jgi:hypothetical protein
VDHDARHIGTPWMAMTPKWRRPTMIRTIATAPVYVEAQQRAVQVWTKQVGFEVRRERPLGPDAVS